jgi:hypothetical protein
VFVTTSPVRYNISCPLQHLLFVTTSPVRYISCSLQHLLFVTTSPVRYNISCSLQHLLFVTTSPVCYNISCSLQHLPKPGNEIIHLETHKILSLLLLMNYIKTKFVMENCRKRPSKHLNSSYMFRSIQHHQGAHVVTY